MKIINVFIVFFSLLFFLTLQFIFLQIWIEENCYFLIEKEKWGKQNKQITKALWEVWSIWVLFFFFKQPHFDEFSLWSAAGQETSKQALQEIVILPALRPEVSRLSFVSWHCFIPNPSLEIKSFFFAYVEWRLKNYNSWHTFEIVDINFI